MTLIDCDSAQDALGLFLPYDYAINCDITKRHEPQDINCPLSRPQNIFTSELHDPCLPRSQPFIPHRPNRDSFDSATSRDSSDSGSYFSSPTLSEPRPISDSPLVIYSPFVKQIATPLSHTRTVSASAPRRGKRSSIYYKTSSLDPVVPTISGHPPHLSPPYRSSTWLGSWLSYVLAYFVSIVFRNPSRDIKLGLLVRYKEHLAQSNIACIIRHLLRILAMLPILSMLQSKHAISSPSANEILSNRRLKSLLLVERMNVGSRIEQLESRGAYEWCSDIWKTLFNKED